jgi:hypothetical protein
MHFIYLFIFNQDIEKGDRFADPRLLQWWDHTRKSYTLPQIIKIKKCRDVNIILS